jgi:nitrogen fixation protein
MEPRVGMQAIDPHEKMHMHEATIGSIMLVAPWRTVQRQIGVVTHFPKTFFRPHLPTRAILP